MLGVFKLITLLITLCFFRRGIFLVLARNCFDDPTVLNAKVVYITSFGSSFYNHVARNGAQETVLNNIPKGHTLIVYHEDEIPEIDGVCRMDLFKEIPTLEHDLIDPASGINKYFELATYFDPINENVKNGDLDSGKILMLKVAAIKLGVASAKEGQIVMWLDTDVSFREDLPESAIAWLSQRDVTYIPLYFQNHNQNPFDTYNFSQPEQQSKAFYAQYWRVESGILAFNVNAKTKSLTERALGLYQGELFDLAKKCFDKDTRCTKTERMGANVYTNDIFIWPLLLMSDIHNDTFFFHEGLRHGTFVYNI